MTVRVAINGFGRIGRLVLRAIIENKRTDVKVVAINDLGSPHANAHLLKYDSVHGPLGHDVNLVDGGFDAGMGFIRVCQEKEPKNLPWKDLDIDVVMECSGFFTSKEKASGHLHAGAKKVLVSAPCTEADYTVVYGVNHAGLTKDHTVISNGSCTTNCLAPVAHVLDSTVGITKGFMTTVHAYTGDQRLQDSLHSDLRRARAAALSMIPSSTGAAKALGLVLPQLKGKLDGVSVRVPTANVSMIDLTVVTGRTTTAEEINAAMAEAANGKLKGVLGACSEELVSSDFNHNPLSSIFDLTQTYVVDGNFVRVLSWYDNEWGFSNRMSDVAVLMGKLG